MGAGESVYLRQLINDAREYRERRKIDIEEFRARGLTCEADIGERYGVAVRVAAGRFVVQMSFEGGQRGSMPVPAPCQRRRLVEFEFVLQVFAHPWHDQRMRIAGDDL